MVTTPIVFILLALMWGVVLVPPYMRRREEDRANRVMLGSMSSAGRAAPASVLGRRGPDPLAPRSLHQARQRRLNVLISLAATFLVSAVAAVAFGGVLLVVVTALAGGVLAAYVGLLGRHTQLEAERLEKVRFLDQPHDVSAPVAEQVSG